MRSATAPRRVGEGLGLALAITLLVVPVVFAMSSGTTRQTQIEDLLTAWIPALVLGLGTWWRLGRRSGLSLGLILGGATGLMLSCVLGLTPMRGFGVLLPPTIGLVMGLLDGVGRARFDGFREGITVAIPIALAAGLGLIARQGVTVVLPAAFIGLVVGTLLGMRRDPTLGWRGGVRRPPWWLAATVLLLCVAMYALLLYEMRRGQSGSLVGGRPALSALVFVLFSLFVLPLVGFHVGAVFARWLRPRLEVLSELVAYLRAMYVPIGAFSLGYSVILIVFAGLYGSLYRLDGAHFGTPEPAPGRADWLFFALYSAVGTTHSPLRPDSDLAHGLVAGQSIVGVGWAVVVFAAVMSHLQPRLAKISRRSQELSESGPSRGEAAGPEREPTTTSSNVIAPRRE